MPSNMENLVISRGLKRRASEIAGHYKSLISDLVLKWRHPDMAHAFAIKSHLTLPERVALTNAAKNRTHVCEIGSYVGASACCFGIAMSKSVGAGRILCIDTWNNDAMTEGSRDTFAEFQTNTRKYSEFIVPIRGYSTAVDTQIADITARLDLLFIDGDHSYEGVRADWDSYKRFLVPGSIVVFHDCGWAIGVQQVIRECVLPVVTNVGGLPNMWWGTIRNAP